jgi:hypothetical protein
VPSEQYLGTFSFSSESIWVGIVHRSLLMHAFTLGIGTRLYRVYLIHILQCYDICGITIPAVATQCANDVLPLKVDQSKVQVPAKPAPELGRLQGTLMPRSEFSWHREKVLKRDIITARVQIDCLAGQCLSCQRDHRGTAPQDRPGTALPAMRRHSPLPNLRSYDTRGDSEPIGGNNSPGWLRGPYTRDVVLSASVEGFARPMLNNVTS